MPVFSFEKISPPDRRAPVPPIVKKQRGVIVQLSCTKPAARRTVAWKIRSLSPSSQALFDLVAGGTLSTTVADDPASGASGTVGSESARSVRQSRR